MTNTRPLSPAKAGYQSNVWCYQGRRASRLPLAIKFHAFGVRAIFLIFIFGR